MAEQNVPPTQRRATCWKVKFVVAVQLLLTLTLNLNVKGVQGFTPSCLGWKPAGGGLPIPNNTFTPGTQSHHASAFCRYNDSHASVLVGKYNNNGPCFFCSPKASAGERNGTADKGYELATATATCGVQFVRVVGEGPSSFPNITVTAGVDTHGAHVGLCLATNGEGSGSEIPGQVFLEGPRLGQCCWSAGYKEQCTTAAYYYMVAKGKSPQPIPGPPKPPPVTPEPTPALLEKNGKVFDARLSFGPGGVPSIMGLTFSTPNTTKASYNPTVKWATTAAALFKNDNNNDNNNNNNDNTNNNNNNTNNNSNNNNYNNNTNNNNNTNSSNSNSSRCTSSPPRSCYTSSPVVHICNMTSLIASTQYYYQFGDPVVGFSQIYSFTTPPQPGAKAAAAKLSVVVYGDMGLDYSKGTRAMLAKMAAADEFDFVIHNGDISYADNHISHRNDPGVAPSIYNDWMNVFYANVSAYATRKPYMMSPGNHEEPCSYGEYEARAAAMPHWGAGSRDVQLYSYNVGPVHVIALSGESGRFKELGTAEVAWLEADLAAAASARDKGDIGWIISHVHYPNIPTGYCSSMMTYCCADGNVGLRSELEGNERYATVNNNNNNNHDNNNKNNNNTNTNTNINNTNNTNNNNNNNTTTNNNNTNTASCVDFFMTNTSKYIEDLFVTHHVDLHITAHQHVYERTTPVYRYQAYGNGSERFPKGNAGTVFVKPEYPININNGCPGNVELQDVWMPRPSWSVGGRFNSDGSGNTTATNYADFGVVKITFDGRKSATISYISSHNGSTIDEFTIFK